MIPSVEEIEGMDRAALSTAWEETLGVPVPKGLSKPFLRRFLAFELQAKAQGGLPKGFIAKLRKASAETGRPRPMLKPGGRLVREWNGVTHVVDIIDGGVLWNGQRYASLSAVARAITGARWSGPRFFGLRGSA